MSCPFLLQNNAADGDSGTGENRGECAGCIAEAAVKPPDHHRAGSAEPDGCHDHHEHIEIIQLNEPQAEGQKKSRDSDGTEPQPQQMLPGRERLLAKRHDDVLQNGRGSIEYPRIVGRKHQHDHQQRKQPEQAGRQRFPENHRQHHLLVESAESLEFEIAVAVLSDDVPDFPEYVGIKVGFAGQRLILADDMPLLGHGRDRVDDLPAFRIGFDGFGGCLRGKGVADHFGLRRVVPVVHDGYDHDGERNQHDSGETAPPGAENSRHFLFMRRLRRTGSVVAVPAGTAEQGGEKPDDERKDIEIPQPAYVIRIEETFSGYPVHHGGGDFRPP